MKKFFTLLMVVLVAFSTQAQTLRVGTNDSKADQAPIYVTQADRYYCTQIIYSADNLTAMQGKTITKLAFFLKAVNTNGDYSGVEIRLKIVDYAAFTEKVYESIDDAVLVFNGTLPAGSETELEVTLNEPFLYESGHLLVDVRKTVSGGKYAPTGSSSIVGRFQATYTEGVYTVLTDYNSSAVPKSPYYQNSKRPDIKFTYSDAAPVSCAKINTLESSAVTANSATLTWTSEAEKYQFVCVLKGAEPAWTANSQAVKTVTLDTLKSNTEYDFYVRSFCSDTEQGVAKKVSFKTDLACYAPTLLAVPEETVTSESAVVSWHASGKGETQYQYTYGLYGSDPDWSKATLTSELSATLTGLNAASPYQVWVRSYCSADDQSDAATEYFATACGAVALPFNDDFSNGIDCWTTKNLASYSGVSSKGEFAFAWQATPPYQTIITPAIIASEKQVSVTFQYKAHNSNYPESFKVGYSTTTNDLENAFTWSDSVKSNSTSYETYFDILPAGVKYVAIQCWSNDQYYLYIDNFSVAEFEAPKCPAPAGLAATNIAAKSATLAWVSEATAWNYQLSADGENWGEAKAAATNPFDLDNLKANTLYYARVQANCGENGTSEWTEAISFTTDCGALSLPYAEGFEGTEANKLPNCWTRVSTDEFPAVFVDGAFYSKAYEGSKSLKFYGYEIDQIAVLPILEEELSKVELSFYYTATDDADAPAANVGYITDLMDATSFVAVKTLDATESYTQAKVTFAGAPANASIAIQYNGGDFFGSLYVDNLEVTEASEIPTAIDNTTVTNSAVKRIVNGQIIIEHNGTRYTILGTELK
jgi:hypothetical protein